MRLQGRKAPPIQRKYGYGSRQIRELQARQSVKSSGGCTFPPLFVYEGLSLRVEHPTIKTCLTGNTEGTTMIYPKSTNTCASARQAAPTHPCLIMLMWLLYIGSPILTTIHFHIGMILLPAVLFSLVSFALAVWLVFQRSTADMLNGGAKLVLDAIVMIALLCTIIQSGALARLMTSLHI